ncbi:MAG: APC family permease, partial [Mycobacteriales bacterium]
MAAVTSPGPTKDFEASDRKLARTLSRSQLLLLSLGAIIGSGWLFSALAAAAGTGPSAVLSWVVGGILVLFIALTYAEVSTMLPRSGAVVRYPHLTHGGFVGFILGWAYLLASASVPAIEAIAVVQYLAPHTPTSWHLLVNHQSTSSILHFPQGWLVTVVLLVIFFFINIYGARFLGRLNNGVMVWKLAIPILTFILLFALSFHAGNFTAGKGFAPYTVKQIFVVIPGAGIIFSYLGFRQGLDYGGEAAHPQRDIPFATIGSVIIGIVIYTLLQVAFTGGIVWSHLGLKAGDFAGLGNVNTATTSPFYALMKASGVGFLGGFAALLLVDAAISPAGTGYVYLGTGGRTIYGMGIAGYLPGASRAVSAKRRVPWVALIASLVVAILFSAPSKSWYALVGFITLATVFTYIMGGTSLQVFRRTAPDLARPYRLPMAGWWAPVSFLAAAVIIFWSGYQTLAELLAAVFVALPLYCWFFAVDRGLMSRAV